MRIYRRNDFDDDPTPDPVFRDDRLRGLVDSLPDAERHMVSRVYFGQATLVAATGELGVSRTTGNQLLASGLERLKAWLVDDVVPEETPLDRTPMDLPSHWPVCGRETDWGVCTRPAVGAGPCAAHTFWDNRGITPNPDYERAVVEGHCSVHEFLTETEMESLVNGRYRGDGRRIDQYAPLEGPLGWTP